MPRPCSDQRRDEVGHHQHRQLNPLADRRVEAVQYKQRSTCEAQPEREDQQPMELVARCAAATADAERECAVGRGVADRRQQQRRQVGGLGAHRGMQHQVQQRVGQRAGDADDAEPDHLADHALRHPRYQRLAAEAALQLAHRQRPGGQRPAHPPAALEVVDRGVHDVDAGVQIVNPVDRHLVDAQAGTLGDHQQLGVEEPACVGDQRQQLTGHVGAHGLEPALRIGEARPQRAAQDQIVTARDEFTLRATHHSRRRCQP